jgi:hypothetical protein
MKPKKLTYNGSSKVIQYIVTCVNWLLDNGGGSVSSLSDVELTNLSDGQILQYSSTSEKWENTDNQGSLPFEIVIDENDNGINIVYDDGGE